MARKNRNNFIAGIFVLFSVAALAAVLVAIQKWDTFFDAPDVYYVQFDNIAGIRTNSDVMVKGQSRGRVAAIEPVWTQHSDCADQTVRDLVYLVTLELRLEHPLRQDSEIVITTPVIGEGGAISINRLGTGEVAGADPARPIMGRSFDMIEAMLAGLGIGDQQRKEIPETISNITAFSASLKDQGPHIAAVLENVEHVTGELREKLPPLLASAQQSSDSLAKATADIEGMLADNRQDIRKTIEAVHKTTARLEADVAELMKTADAALGSLSAAGDDVRTIIAANRINIDDTLTNIRLTSEQLKAATADMQRAPWRLLHRPDERQSDTLNIFDATRNYANAAASLRSAASTLQSISAAQQSGAAVNVELLNELQDRLRQSLQRYTEAEDALWKLWNEKGPAQGETD